MSLFKRLRPYLLGGLIVGGGLYAKNKMEKAEVIPEKPEAIVEQSTVELINVRECPELPEPVFHSCPPVPICPPPEIKYVETPVKHKSGCFVDWKSGEASGYTTKHKSLRCTFDYLKKTVIEEFSDNPFVARQAQALKRLQ